MTPVAIVISLMIIGFVLIAIEIFVIPGVSVPGVLGLLAMLGAVIYAYSARTTTAAMVALVSGAVACGLMVWLLPRTRAGRAMVLREGLTGGATNARLERLAGAEGTAETDLRPAGTALIGDEPVDVVTDGDYVNAGTRIKVMKVEGARVVVTALHENDGAIADKDANRSA